MSKQLKFAAQYKKIFAYFHMKNAMLSAKMTVYLIGMFPYALEQVMNPQMHKK